MVSAAEQSDCFLGFGGLNWVVSHAVLVEQR
jgi:hypothetical protein